MIRLSQIRECSGMICKANGETPPNSSIIWRHHASRAKKVKAFGRCMVETRIAHDGTVPRSVAFSSASSVAVIDLLPTAPIIRTRYSDTKNPFLSKAGVYSAFDLSRIAQRESR